MILWLVAGCVELCRVRPPGRTGGRGRQVAWAVANSHWTMWKVAIAKCHGLRDTVPLVHPGGRIPRPRGSGRRENHVTNVQTYEWWNAWALHWPGSAQPSPGEARGAAAPVRLKRHCLGGRPYAPAWCGAIGLWGCLDQIQDDGSGQLQPGAGGDPGDGGRDATAAWRRNVQGGRCQRGLCAEKHLVMQDAGTIYRP